MLFSTSLVSGALKKVSSFLATPTSGVYSYPETNQIQVQVQVPVQIQVQSLQRTHQIKHSLHDVSVRHLSGLDESLQHSKLHADAPDGHGGRDAPSTRGRVLLRHSR